LAVGRSSSNGLPDELPAWPPHRVALFHARYSERLPPDLLIKRPQNGAWVADSDGRLLADTEMAATGPLRASSGARRQDPCDYGLRLGLPGKKRDYLERRAGRE
jgi:hypothetical protein